MARRPKQTSGPAPAHRATPPVTEDAYPPAGAVGAGPVDFSPPAPSALAPGATEPDVPVDVSGVRAPDTSAGATDPNPVVAAVVPEAPAAAVSCRHAVMRAGWDGKGKGRKPIRRCDECGYTVPCDEDGRPTVMWT